MDRLEKDISEGFYIEIFDKKQELLNQAISESVAKHLRSKGLVYLDEVKLCDGCTSIWNEHKCLICNGTGIRSRGEK